MRNRFLLLALITVFSCQPKSAIEWVSTTFDNPWQVMDAVASDAPAEASVVVDLTAVNQTVEGFGTCFNELGWTSLSELSEKDRAAILEDLFAPAGMNLTLARMPLGANDFSVDFYSYDEVPGPWCPPMWMKVSGHYASRSAPFNGLPLDKQVPEGVDAFILEPAYLQAYAQYFGKFIDAYKAEGIDIFMVMPQNEPNSDQVFPSCTWTPDGLIAFLKYLEPEMASRDVDVYLGTMERANPDLWDRILTDPEVGPSIKGMGFQWAGKDALPELHRRHPALPCYQTEQECGDGQNDWRGAMHSWELMKHYFGNGVQSYFYWNTSLLDGGISTWMWRQNSLVVVDKENKTFRYSPEYYVLKHASHYVQPGARVLALGGTYADALGFQNPDGRTVFLLANQGDAPKTVSIEGLPGRPRTVTLPAGSINTLVL